MERMIKLLLLAVITAQTCKYQVAAETTVNNVVRDIKDSICHLNFFGKVFLYLHFCEDDGFDSCDETVYTPGVSNDGKAVVSLDCNNECPRETNAVVVWNIHLLSENYDISLSCWDGNCVSKNKETELLKLEQEFTMTNATLGFQYYPLYQGALVGCVRTTNSCTENHYWLINGVGLTGSGSIKISTPANKTKYYAALGENLIVPCVAYGDHQASVSWCKWQTSVIQFTQHCRDFDESYSSKLCILPSLDDYQRERVKSRVLKFEECRGQPLVNNTLDISVADWTDNGTSYSCVSSPTEHSGVTEEVYINIVVDVIPEFIHTPAPYAVHNAMSSYSCVAKAGHGAKLQWHNASGHVVAEYSPDDTSPPSVYVTYSMDNVPTVLTGKDSIYTGDPIDSVYPVHNATLHINGTPYHDQNRNFTCVITGVNVEFLQQYNVPDESLTYSMTVHI